MAAKPYRVCRLHTYTDRDGRQQEKWKDTGIVMWRSGEANFRLDVPISVTLHPDDALMAFAPRDDDDRGSRGGSSRGGRQAPASAAMEDEPGTEELYDDDIPF